VTAGTLLRPAAVTLKSRPAATFLGTCAVWVQKKQDKQQQKEKEADIFCFSSSDDPMGSHHHDEITEYMTCFLSLHS